MVRVGDLGFDCLALKLAAAAGRQCRALAWTGPRRIAMIAPRMKWKPQ
jgi:hypothetical protein